MEKIKSPKMSILQKHKKIVVILVKILIPLIIFYFLLQRINFTDIIEIIFSAKLNFVLFPLFLFGVNILILSYKLSLLLKPFNILIRLSKIFYINLVSMFYTIFLFGEISGGIVKWYKISKTNKAYLQVFTAIITERMTNIIALFSIGLLIVLATPVLNQLIKGLNLVIAAVLLLLVSLFFLLFNKKIIYLPQKLKHLASIIIPQKILQKIELIRQSFINYHLHKNILIKAILLSFLFQALTALGIYSLALSAGINLNLFQLTGVVVVTNIIQLLPFSFGGLGIREGALVVLFGYYGINAAQALSFSLLIFSLSVIMGLIGGAIELLSYTKPIYAKNNS